MTRRCKHGGLITDRNQMNTHFENLTLMENTSADLTCELKTENNDTFRIEVKICEAGSFYPVCVCRWFSNGSKCTNGRNISMCEADSMEMRISIRVRRNFSDVLWELLEQNSTPVLLRHTKLQVTYPPEIIQLTVNGQEVNGKFITKENQKFTITCSYTNGNPPVYIRMFNNTGHVFRSTNNREGTLVTFLSVYCRDMWPTVSCEAPGSKLNKSVTILVKCLPQLFYMSSQSVDLKGAATGLTLGLKSYTSDIKSCLMTSLHDQSIAREVICELSGSAPEFNLTLRVAKESWLEEGIWMLHVMTELGFSNITVNITNTTVQPETTGSSQDNHHTLILFGCALSATSFIAVIVIYFVLKLVKRRSID
ncbi:uncharacterized protein LOC112568608 [Pomacea canaliculata]|uniref:uncharacterized protein LOC112568608 n=1 Tax=Pomacea canaliculata TaxID=400727 RepID=UPI000D7393D2|nr:uncharacterized protein LOC112568608 [Pomacea canaliculata]